MTIRRAEALNAAVTTQRLLLEPLTRAHAAKLFAPMQDEKIYHWISETPPLSVESLQRRWAAAEARLSPSRDKAWLNWAVRRASDGEYVGKLDAEVEARNVATNVGYLFFPAFWSQGYATEAVRALIAHFKRQGVTESRALVTLGNDASERVLVKAGFTRTRVIPDNDVIRGVTYDDVEYISEMLGTLDDSG